MLFWRYLMRTRGWNNFIKSKNAPKPAVAGTPVLVSVDTADDPEVVVAVVGVGFLAADVDCVLTVSLLWNWSSAIMCDLRAFNCPEYLTEK